VGKVARLQAVPSMSSSDEPPPPRRVRGYSNGELTKQRGRRHASVFNSSAHSVAGARRWARMVTGLPRSEAYTLELVVSELVTNAIEHTATGSPGGSFTIGITFLDASRIRVAVTDSGPQLDGEPQYPNWFGACPDDDHGRGLPLVKALSRRTGVLGEVGGPLTVWAVIDRADLR